MGAGLALVGLMGMAIVVPRPVRPPAEAYVEPDVEATNGAIDWFEERLAGDPTNTLLAAHLASRYVRRFQLVADMRDVARAEALARRILPLSRDRGRAWARLSGVLLARHAFGEALAAAREAVAQGPRDMDAWGALYDAAFAAGKYAEAERALTRLEPGVGRRVREALWLEARGETDRAAARLGEACRSMFQPGRRRPLAWCLTELGHLELRRKGPRAAAVLYAAALEALPGYREAVEGLADLAYARRDWGEAKRLYRRIAVDAHPDLYLRLAEIRRLEGDVQAAERWQKEFLRVATAPGAEPLHAHPLALLWAEHAETRDAALAVALRDVGRRPTIQSWDVLAWVRFRRGEFGAALAASDRAFAWGVPSPTMEYHRGRILQALGFGADGDRLIASALAQRALLEPHLRLELDPPDPAPR